ncbi:MAG TPA: helix-turn-helix transcriptional regulator [Rhizobium sp.]
MDRPISRPEDVARRLKDIRLKQNLSVRDFSQQLDVSSADYLAYESGGNIPSLIVARLFERFYIDPMWLLLGYKRDSISEHAEAASAAYKGILEAAERVNVMLRPEVFAYAISAATNSILSGALLEPSHADVLVKLATINSKKM